MIPRISPIPGNPLIDRKHDMRIEKNTRIENLKKKKKGKGGWTRGKENDEARDDARENLRVMNVRKKIYMCVYVYILYIQIYILYIYIWKKGKKVAFHYLIFIVSRYIGLAEKKSISRFMCNVEGF